jgi:hypothetical protein
MAASLVSDRPMNLQALYGRPGDLQVVRARGAVRRGAVLTPEVVARVDEALRACPAEDLPSSYARQLYQVLVSHGLDRADLLALVASLVDQVASDVSCPGDNVG